MLFFSPGARLLAKKTAFLGGGACHGAPDLLAVGVSGLHAPALVLYGLRHGWPLHCAADTLLTVQGATMVISDYHPSEGGAENK